MHSPKIILATSLLAILTFAEARADTTKPISVGSIGASDGRQAEALQSQSVVLETPSEWIEGFRVGFNLGHDLRDSAIDPQRLNVEALWERLRVYYAEHQAEFVSAAAILIFVALPMVHF